MPGRARRTDDASGRRWLWTHRQVKAGAPGKDFVSRLVSEMCVIPEAASDKGRAYPAPNNVKEAPAFVGLLGVGGLSCPPGTVPPSLTPPGKERARVGLGIRAVSRLWGNKVLAKQLKGLGGSQVGLLLS